MWLCVVGCLCALRWKRWRTLNLRVAAPSLFCSPLKRVKLFKYYSIGPFRLLSAISSSRSFTHFYANGLSGYHLCDYMLVPYSFLLSVIRPLHLTCWSSVSVFSSALDVPRQLVPSCFMSCSFLYFLHFYCIDTGLLSLLMVWCSYVVFPWSSVITSCL